MTASWYWLLFALAAILWLAVPLAHKWEQRQDRRDHAHWDAWMRGPR